MAINLISDLVEIEHAITRAIYTAQAIDDDKVTDDLRKLRLKTQILTNSKRKESVHNATA